MCFASSAERTFRAHTLANMIAESISSPDFTKTIRSRRHYQGVGGHFSQAKKNRPETNNKM